MRVTRAAAILMGWFAAVPAAWGNGELLFEDAWARATIGGSTVSAVYLAITNRSDAPARLVGADAERAEQAMVHRSVVEDGLMKMRHLDAVEIPAGATVRLEPGGMHVMLMGVSPRLDAGERLFVTLRFERAGEVKLAIPVRRSPPK